MTYNEKEDLFYYDHEFQTLYWMGKSEVKCQYCGTTIREIVGDPYQIIETCNPCQKYEDENHPSD